MLLSRSPAASLVSPQRVHVNLDHEAVDGFAVDGHTLRANFGTTKCPEMFFWIEHLYEN